MTAGHVRLFIFLKHHGLAGRWYAHGMRHTWLLLPVVLPLVAFAACSSSSDGSTSSSTADGGKTAPATDGGGGTDPGTDAGVSNNGSDAGTLSGGPCTLPVDCSGTDVCCGTIPITGGTIPNCTTGAVSTVCTAPGSCKTNLGSTCSGTQTVRICTKPADCKESGANQCCKFSDSDGGSLTFCANGLVSALGGGKCM
jgi:hypothetical protein